MSGSVVPAFRRRGGVGRGGAHVSGGFAFGLQCTAGGGGADGVSASAAEIVAPGSTLTSGVASGVALALAIAESSNRKRPPPPMAQTADRGEGGGLI